MDFYFACFAHVSGYFCLYLVFSAQAFLFLRILWPQPRFFSSGIPPQQFLFASASLSLLRHSYPAISLCLSLTFLAQAFLPGNFSLPQTHFLRSGIPLHPLRHSTASSHKKFIPLSEFSRPDFKKILTNSKSPPTSRTFIARRQKDLHQLTSDRDPVRPNQLRSTNHLSTILNLFSTPTA